MRALRGALWPAGLALGVAAEWMGRPPLVVLDAVTGFALLGLGLAAWSLRDRSRAGPIMAAGGAAWFLGSLGGWALYLHRGPLAQLALAYPGRRSNTRLERTAIVLAYAYAATYPVAHSDYATIAFALCLVAVAVWRFGVAVGPERRARLAGLSAGAAFGLVLGVEAAARIAALENGRTQLVVYDLVVCLIGVGLFADLLWGRWTSAAVTDLVVDLGHTRAAGPLRTRLARALGDPTLVLGYWVPDQNRYVDDAGRPVELPAGNAGRAVTPVNEGGNPIAVLVHDAAVLDDPVLVASVASAARLAVSNVRLRAEVAARVSEVEGSRRRIVEAADVQRRRLERELREGAERRLAHVAALLDVSGAPLTEVRLGLDSARSELRRFAQGIHPAALTDAGLSAALNELAARSPIPVEVRAPGGRLPPAVETAAYFVCSEALANVAKHAAATRVEVDAGVADGRLRLKIADDGSGGADPRRGSGLRGLADRVEALGGGLRVTSPPGKGTELVAELPLS
jgi:signal transduction histidine kinase